LPAVVEANAGKILTPPAAKEPESVHDKVLTRA